MKKIMFVLSISFVFIVAVVDLVLTYIMTPDLSADANPLVTVFGLGWTAILITQVLFLILSVALCYIAHFKYNRVSYPTADTFREFYSLLFFGRKGVSLFTWRMPKNLLAYASFVNTCLIAGVSMMRLQAIYVWASHMHRYGVQFRFLRNPRNDRLPLVNSIYNLTDTINSILNIDINYFTGFFVPVFVVLILSVVFWFYNEYRWNKRNLYANEV